MMENDGKTKSDETVTFQYIHTCTYSSLQEGSADHSQASVTMIHQQDHIALQKHSRHDC